MGSFENRRKMATTISEEKTLEPNSVVQEDAPVISEPTIAGILAWLVPGAGHLYQKRYVKAAIFFWCIVPILLMGIWMGSYRETVITEGSEPVTELRLGRTVWYSWRSGDRRLYYIPQAMIGTVGITAIIQAQNVGSGSPPFFYGIFAPPSLDGRNGQPTLNAVIEHLYSYYDLGVLFTVVAGLMNVLAIFDAIGGPVFIANNNKN